MQPDQFFPLVVFFIVVCLLSRLKQWLLRVLTDFDEDLILTRDFRIVLGLASAVLLAIVFLGGWEVAAVLLSAPCFWALGRVMRGGPRGSRRKVAVRRIPSPASIPGFRGRQELASWARAVVGYVIFLIILYWTTHR